MIGRLLSVALTAATFGLGAAGIYTLQRSVAQAAPSICEQRTFEGEGFTVCKFDPRKQDLKLTTKYRKLPELAKGMGAERNRVLFAMNAGMYDKAGAPIGLYVENGKQGHAINTKTGLGNFYMKPNGVFWLDASGVHASTSDAYAAAKPKPIWATQSGPMLLASGKMHPEIKDDGPSRNVRNGVGVRDTHTAFFVISDKAISFGKLARLFRDELKCDDALYLDGVVSSLWLPDKSRADDGFDLGPILVVSSKK